MNIVSKVTWMSMKKNRKRTLVTIFGVIISVAMITAVLVSIDSFMDVFRQREISASGRWTAEYQNINREQLKKLKSNEKLSEVMVRGELGYSILGETNNPNKKYIYTEAVDAEAMKDMQMTVTKGRLPQADTEIVLSAQLVSDMGDIYAIGDTIHLDFGHREMESDKEPLILDQSYNYQGDDQYGEYFVPDGRSASYTIVGFIEPMEDVYSWAAGYEGITFFDADRWPQDQTFNARVILDKIDANAYKTAAQISEEIGNPDYRLHEALLKYYGVTADDGMNFTFKLIGGFLIVIIMIGSVMLIYNAFAISLSERSRQLGMLSSVGATRAQKRRSVFFEGAVIGAVSIPLGFLAGIGGMAVTFKCIEPMVNRLINDEIIMRCVVKPSTVIIAIVLAGITIFVSSWIPAVRAAKITPIESIRQSRDVKMTKRQVKTSRLTRRIFGFEGELALKNLKRNKKSYRITIISLTLSFTLFLSVSGYVTMLQKAFFMTGPSSNYDVYALSRSEASDAAALCTSLKEAEDYNIVTRGNVDVYLNDKEYQTVITEDYKKILDTYDLDRLGISFRGMTEEKLKEFMNRIGMDPSAFEVFAEQGTDGIPVILINRYSMVTGSYEWKEMTVANVCVGDTFSLTMDSYDDEGNFHEIDDAVSMSIIGVTDQCPMGIAGDFYPGMDIFAITLDSYVAAMSEKWLGEDAGYEEKYIYMKSSDPEALTEAVKELYDNYPGKFSFYYSVWETEQSDRALLTMLQVFCYGFIALMTLICTANILNTVSTGIDLRRRELAMLKSVGMTPKAFNRMVLFESLFYGIKTLLYGLPIGIAVIIGEYYMMDTRFSFGFALPIPHILAAIVMLFIVVSVSMAYSFGKIRRENIVDGLRTE